MSGEFDSRKAMQSTKFEQRPKIFVKLSFKEFWDSKLSALDVFDNMTIEFKYVENRRVGCEFTRQQSLK